MKPFTQFILIVILALVVVTVSDIFNGSCLYIIDETEQVVITRFGAPVGEPIKDPGLKFKWPVIHKANFFPKNILEWDGEPSQIPTKGKKNIYVDIFARWKIVDALTYFKKVTHERRAQSQLDSILNAAVRNLIQSHPLIESVRNSNRIMEIDILTESTDEKTGEQPSRVELGRYKLTRLIMEQAQAKVKDLGIKLVDVQFKRINYTPSVREEVFKRMISERQQIAAKYRSEGQGESQRIQGLTAKELKTIEAEAYRKSQAIKGKADAEAARIYAEAYGKDQEFYALVKTLELYKTLPEKEIELLLSTDSEFFKYLKGIKP